MQAQPTERHADPQVPIASAHTTIYDELRADQFRMLCLSPVADCNDPIHVDLETYDDNNCPEYKFTSYAWGGEDGDSSLQSPVYVDEYWDVLLQTKNCWSLLQYLRPRRGIRLVWLDAICIDQSNTRERDAQVVKMGDIYRNCSRVVVYLGKDVAQIVSDTSERSTIPRRFSLDEVVDKFTDASIDPQKLFQLQYFTRVWIIQELLLPPGAIIPLNSFEFLVTRLTPGRLEAKWQAKQAKELGSESISDWDSTGAPWFQYAAGGADEIEQGIWGILQHTWSSHTSDARDKIFGVLGLIDTKEGATENATRNRGELQSATPTPNVNYSISNVHIFLEYLAIS
ncbi:hypothetical protein BU23DRAFT_485692 [Bimuria novae-zelandiae CBS 107.79]|uniref:Heterokaryon incompatibility domain-containing protein n=1 Tax=Bimuria novae-zelandiae CBS 107.79 TaxID=1447943 RepID=A0A6A5UPK0_9PLEO|nr:hypothetical protein BU23DRAFT_485692 [Bimuria novae-zelandiae CBS 107.79]